MNFSAWPYHPNHLPANPQERQQRLNQLEADFVQELTARPDVQHWLASFIETGHEAFLKQHAYWRVGAIMNFQDNHHQLHDAPELRYRSRCEFCLDMILQKKLFNLQLQWRAEQITLPGVQLSCQFNDIRDHIRECSFIAPITFDEVELMQRFLLTEDGEELLGEEEDGTGMIRWQDVEDLLQTDDEGNQSYYPAWYAYYDTYFGTGSLLSLPDIRGKKEDYYLELAQEEAEKQRAPSPPQQPFLHTLWYSSEQERFIDLFEDQWFKEVHAESQQLKKREAGAESYHDVEGYIDLLRECHQTIPIEGGSDWREALRRCAYGSLAALVSAELEPAYAEYSLYRELNLGSSDKRKRYHDTIFNHLAQAILCGRKAAGEPETLDF